MCKLDISHIISTVCKLDISHVISTECKLDILHVISTVTKRDWNDCLNVTLSFSHGRSSDGKPSDDCSCEKLKVMVKYSFQFVTYSTATGWVLFLSSKLHQVLISTVNHFKTKQMGDSRDPHINSSCFRACICNHTMRTHDIWQHFWNAIFPFCLFV